MLDWLLSALALGLALWTRPWRLLRGGALVTPLLACLVLLPWLWALPRLHAMPLQMQWSGACLVVLMLGWPLAVWVLLGVALVSAGLAPIEADALVTQLVWQGLLPASTALALGAALRRWVGHHPFVYILGRGFVGTALSVFLVGGLAQWLDMGPPLAVDGGLSLVARWLMAWGDAFLTGMLAAIFVAFKPQWLATWSDQLYLQRPQDENTPD